MRLVAFLLLLALTGPTWAGNMAIVMPGGGLIYKKVESIRERKFANLERPAPYCASSRRSRFE